MSVPFSPQTLRVCFNVVVTKDNLNAPELLFKTTQDPGRVVLVPAAVELGGDC